MTKAQVDLLNKYQIIPIAFAELKVSNETLLTRAEIDRNSKDRSVHVYMYMYVHVHVVCYVGISVIVDRDTV